MKWPFFTDKNKIKEQEDYILKLEQLILDMSKACLCTRNTKGFDYHQKHEKLGSPKDKRWLTPNELLDYRINYRWNYANEFGCGESWKHYDFKMAKQPVGYK